MLAVTLCVLVIVPPEWPDLVLTAHIPHSEADVLVLDSLYVESCRTAGKKLQNHS